MVGQPKLGSVQRRFWVGCGKYRGSTNGSWSEPTKFLPADILRVGERICTVHIRDCRQDRKCGKSYFRPTLRKTEGRYGSPSIYNLWHCIRQDSSEFPDLPRSGFSRRLCTTPAIFTCSRTRLAWPSRLSRWERVRWHSGWSSCSCKEEIERWVGSYQRKDTSSKPIQAFDVVLKTNISGIDILAGSWISVKLLSKKGAPE